MDPIEHDNVAMEDLENEPDSVNSSVGNKRVWSTHSKVLEYFQKSEVMKGEIRHVILRNVRSHIFWRGAKDVLAVPITAVAFESAFSISGRVLDYYRSSLKDDTMEALLCMRDFLYGNAIAMEVEQEDEDISKFHVDAEYLTQLPTPSLGYVDCIVEDALSKLDD